jgi:hypothetical protein
MRAFWLGLAVSSCAIASQAIVNVGIQLDSSRAASAVIPVTGGTLTATAADGTVFTLTIPDRALVSGERITMTPVAAIERLPMSGGLVGAVQLEPAGLRLFQPATLVIQPSVPIPFGSEAPIAWHGGGSDLYLHPLVRDPKTITFKWMHFSGAGMSSGTSADRAAVQGNSPCDAESAGIQRVYAVLSPERERAQMDLPPDPNVVPQVVAIFKDYFTNTLVPAMDKAVQSKNEGQMQAAVQRALSWLGQMDIFAAGDPFVEAARQKVMDKWAEALKVRSDAAAERCVKEHRPEQMVTLRSIDRQAALLNLTNLNLRTEEKVAKCGHFELRFDSTITKTANIPMFGYSANMHVLSIVPVEGDPAHGSAALTYEFTLQMNLGSICSVTESHGNNDTFKVLAVEFNMNPKAEEDPCASKRRAAPHAIHTDAYPADAPFQIVSMQIDVGNPTEDGTLRCEPPKLPPYTIPLSQGLGFDHEFPNAFAEFHHDETPKYTIKDWSPGAGTLMGQKLYSNNSAHFDFKWTEATSLNLFHRPQQ